ncbi:LysR family transcriptional regulator [Humibacter albus]|uniref:LysR family transcriptional regulator n=1 Tax=Humibacter albus TaxID=427754 RepID=UPI0003B47B54|nr:LysR family transcriptional regulator [Humibacter albus]
MDLQQLSYFVAIAEEESFTRAAAREHVVQSTVSSAISRLEAELGQQLLTRTPRAARPTEAGMLLLRRARSMLSEATAVQEELAALQGPVAGTVTIGCPLSTGSLNLGRVLHEMRRVLPLVDVRLRVPETANDWNLSSLLDGEFDLALLPKPSSIPQAVQATPVGTLSLVLTTAAGSEEPDRPWSVAEAAAAATVDFPPSWPNRRRTDAYFAQNRTERNVLFEVADVASAIEMIRAGLGAAFLPESLISGWAGIRTVELARAIPSRTLVLAQRSIPQRPAVKAFSDLVIARVAEGVGQACGPAQNSIAPNDR